MDSKQLFNYSSVTSSSSGQSFSSSSKVDIGNSPNSPFSSHLDSEALSTLRDRHDNNNKQNCEELVCGVSCHVNDASCSLEMRHMVVELESVLMAPDNSNEGTTSKRCCSGHDEEGLHLLKRTKSMEEDQLLEGLVPSSNLRELLIGCAKAISENNLKDFDELIEKARGCVSINGEAMQRVGAYLVEGLVARKEASGNNIYRGLRCREPEGKDMVSYMHMMYEMCPYLKFGYMAANGAIAEACRNEDRIHIIDFQIAQGSQWVTLLQALAARPGGPPYVRITGIDDPLSKYARGDGLEAVGNRLALISDQFRIPIEFHGVPVFGPHVTRHMLDVRHGEALAVNFPFQLHHTPDESVHVNNPRDGLLRMVKSLSPKVVTLVEQESNTNTTPFFNRFVETLDYYLAIFDSIHVTLQRTNKERINVEQHCLARDIVNIIACEGKDRVERHELFGKWKSRFTMAGFRQCPMSSYVNSVITTLLRCYSQHYTLVDKDGAMLLAWKTRNLISASAWH